MILAEIIFAGQDWLPWALGLSAVGLMVVVWNYLSSPSALWVRLLSALLKIAAIVLLAACLVDPLFRGTRPRPGSNLFLVVADNSRSLQLSDGRDETRGQRLLNRTTDETPWLTRLGQDFDVRRYTFDTSLHPVKRFKDMPFDGSGSTLATSLDSLAERFQGQPVAGILVLTDGNATDLGEAPRDWKGLPPVYPVLLGAETGLIDLSVSRVAVNQTNFDAAPVTISANLVAQGLEGRKIVVRVVDEAGKEVERRTTEMGAADRTVHERFLIKPEKPGVVFYTVEACLEGEEPALAGRGSSTEATLANNRRLATVDRGGGPYRVLYLAGRPNWEFKFLRRALQEEDEIQLAGLIRIAKKEPKFAFLGRSGEQSNPLFRGFGNADDEDAEQYDQPVLRWFTNDNQELPSGFPKTPEELYAFQAIILDDVEAAFFTQDQLSMVQQFVSRRGGGLLMLGGKESFADGGYSRTPIGEMLPVYLDRTAAPSADGYRLKLTREGWLQPWVRVRSTEQEEEQRLAAMPAFKTINRADAIKPGASVLAELTASDGTSRPGLVVQPFGRGQAAALMVADLWRWGLRRKDPADEDLEKSWRQTIRWLVSDVPQSVEVHLKRTSGATPGIELTSRIRNRLFEPLDNATVRIKVRAPDGRDLEFDAEASPRAAGEYAATFIPRSSGAFRATVLATAADGSEVGSRDTGWAVEPDTDEFQRLPANRPLLERIAADSGGEVVSLDSLEDFVAGLSNRKIPITESWTYPLWHQWSLFTAMIACLVAEWGLRRWKGMP